MVLRLASAIGGLALACFAGFALAGDLAGHGGPVRALAVDGDRVVSGSFDTRTILWRGDLPKQIVLGHVGAVTSVALLPDGFASGGQDGKVVIWGDEPEPLASISAHDAPVAALALTADGLASAGWDGRIRLANGTDFAAHQGQVNGLVAFGDGLASIGTDLALKFWSGERLVASYGLSAPPAALVADGDSVIVAGAGGGLQRFGAEGLRAERALSERPLPVIALAAGDGLIAASSVSGEVWLIDKSDLSVKTVIQTGQGAVWSVAFLGDQVLTGGNDGLIRRWSVDGEPLGEGRALDAAAADDSPGARVWRACAICHALTPDDQGRAGPSLHGIFGRRIGTAQGYAYSDALKALDIVWTEQTVAELFEFGPEAYTPGSRMPEQRLPDPADRAALVDYLKANGG